MNTSKIETIDIFKIDFIRLFPLLNHIYNTLSIILPILNHKALRSSKIFFRILIFSIALSEHHVKQRANTLPVNNGIIPGTNQTIIPSKKKDVTIAIVSITQLAAIKNDCLIY